MKLAKTIIFPAFLFLVTCAYGQDIHYDYDRGTNFSAYRTYQWVDASGGASKADPSNGLPNLPSGPPPIDLPRGGPMGAIPGGASDEQLIGQDIERAVDEQLAQKGLTKVEKNGDLLVAYHAAVREEKSIDLNGMGWGAGVTADGGTAQLRARLLPSPSARW